MISAAPEGAILLAIETAGSLCSAAIARGGDILTCESRVQRHGHAEVLVPMVQRVTAEAGLRAADIDVVAATVGPGGFTGIRVGLAAAHGIALAAKARLIGVTAFAAVAAAVERDQVRNSAEAEALLVAIDSRRAELYVQLFALTEVATLSEPAAISPDGLAAFVAKHAAGRSVLIAGDAREVAAQSLPKAAVRDAVSDARGVVLAARPRLRIGALQEPVRPLYIRPPDVSLPNRPAPVSGG
jgi:tRNA threonylcarbamoyladenosine biosynthesis protein TsaB